MHYFPQSTQKYVTFLSLSVVIWFLPLTHKLPEVEGAFFIATSSVLRPGWRLWLVCIVGANRISCKGMLMV